MPEPKSFIGTSDIISLIRSHYEVFIFTLLIDKQIVSKVFRLIIAFIQKYTNQSYCVGLYLNMNRIIKAELDLNEATREVRQLVK